MAFVYILVCKVKRLERWSVNWRGVLAKIPNMMAADYHNYNKKKAIVYVIYICLLLESDTDAKMSKVVSFSRAAHV